MTTCKCGCGLETKRGRDFISGHNMRGVRRKVRALVKCACCGQDFEEIAERAGKRRYCSSGCRDRHRRSTFQNQGNRNYNRINHPCDFCGRLFKAMPGRIRRLGRAYCSKDCGLKGRGKRLREYANRPVIAWRKAAMVRFNNQCAFCAFTMSDVHHITPRSKGGNNAPENLIVLCPNHHRLCHHGLLAETTMREQVQKVLQQHQ